MIRLADFVIVAAIVAVAISGSSFTTQNLEWYYTSLALPSWSPPGYVISTAWTTIFILTAISAMIFWRRAPRDQKFNWIVTLFIANGLLNVFWSYLFFQQHQLGLAVIEMNALNLTTIALAILLWPISRFASVLLWPYIAWVSFATYLAYAVWQLNL